MNRYKFKINFLSLHRSNFKAGAYVAQQGGYFYAILLSNIRHCSTACGIG